MDDASLLLLERIFQVVFPLVAIVTVGYFYARRIHTDMSVANRVNMDVFTPALILSVMADQSFDLALYQPLAIAAVCVVIGSGLLLAPFCRLIGIHPKTFLPPMMFNNSGNLGIPLAVLAFGDYALPAAVVLFLVENTLHFTLGMYMLNPRTHPLSMLRIPMILAAIAGLVISSAGWVLPVYAKTFIDMLGQIAIPLMLFSLGVRMLSIDLSNWRSGVIGAILCPLSGVLMALATQQVVQLDETQFSYLILFGALPPALLNYLVAERYNQEPQQVASIVLLSNIASLVIIPLTLAFIL
ncbi:AEC family transporter [Marinobacterium sedimentorum]|uniref:AEC family transporter n=1 Tax=Marinobacterium sedimentorum TaxID=2927804 RepID=UPI0020C6A8A2|nr:AEC family transporter [Marinobacterium sedimentorum]MCP8689756.1 AEC family transporter [Marinobacterium sedimentorum]